MADVGLFFNRIIVGLFFAIAGYHKLMVPRRHESLVETLIECRIPRLGFMQWWIPAWELFAGFALVVGFMSAFSAMALFVVCLVATCTDGWKRAWSYRPINTADLIDDFLYLPEVLYMTMLMVVIFNGPGRFSLDYAIMS